MSDPHASNQFGPPPRNGSVAPPGFVPGAAAPRSTPHAGGPHTPAPAFAAAPAPGHDAARYGLPVPTQEQPLPGGPLPGPPPASYGAVLAQTMMLVGVALLLFTVGAVLGGGLEPGTGRLFWLAGCGMLLAQSFVDDLRKGTTGIAWLFALALALGLGFGPVLAYYLSANPDVVAEAAAVTALVVFGTAAYGTYSAHDLAPWMRPVFLVTFVFVMATWVLVFLCGIGMPASSGFVTGVSAVIGLLSAASIVLYFNYLRRHATQQDVVWLATGIFVAILNLFLSLLRVLR